MGRQAQWHRFRLKMPVHSWDIYIYTLITLSGTKQKDKEANYCRDQKEQKLIHWHWRFTIFDMLIKRLQLNKLTLMMFCCIYMKNRLDWMSLPFSVYCSVKTSRLSRTPCSRVQGSVSSSVGSVGVESGSTSCCHLGFSEAAALCPWVCWGGFASLSYPSLCFQYQSQPATAPAGSRWGTRTGPPGWGRQSFHQS